MAIEGYVPLIKYLEIHLLYLVMLQLVLHMDKPAVEKHIQWLGQVVLLLYVSFSCLYKNSNMYK
jgi:hypothetical protein